MAQGAAGPINRPAGKPASSGANLGTYYVVMCDFGRRGREAVVDPELTRGAIIERIARHDFAHDNVIAVHQVSLGEPTLDVTDDVLREAGLDASDAPSRAALAGVF